jgi:hypothetical protein
MPVPGNTMTPAGSAARMASLRLNGVALAWLVQSRNCESAPIQRRCFTRQTVSSRQNEIVSIERVPPFTAMRYLRPRPAVPVRSCPDLSAPLPMNLRTKP